MITYKSAGIDIRVYLDGRHTGTIKRGADGWRYFPRGSKKGGEASHDLAAAKRSLETTP